MQIHKRKKFKKEKTAKGRARQQANYDKAKLKSSGLYDPHQRNRLKVRRISSMTDAEKIEFGVLPKLP